MGTIQIKRGLSANLPTSAAIAEILYTTDTKKFYIGNGENQPLTEFSNYAQLIELLNQKAEKEQEILRPRPHLPKSQRQELLLQLEQN